MGLTSNIKDRDWVSVRQASAKLGSIKLGPTSVPTYAGIKLTGLTDDSLIYPSGGGTLTSLGVATNGQLPIGSTGATPVLAEITGTANQITSTSGAGSITLSTPQDIHTGASPTFAGITLTGISDTQVLYSNATVLAGNAAFTFNDSTGVVTITGVGGSGLTGYDLKIGDTSTPDYGLIQTGDAAFGRVSYNAMNMDLDGSVIIRNLTAPATSNIEFAFLESGGTSVRFALAKSAVGNATYNPRSMLIAGPAVWDDEIVTVGYWQTNNSIFDNLACDTAGTGADLGVQGSVEIERFLYCDDIKESTSGGGITFQPLADSTTFLRVKDAGGNGIFTLDSTNRQTIVEYSSDARPFLIKSSDATDQIEIHHDNNDPYIKWTDGSLRFTSKENNTTASIYIRGPGTGHGEIRCYDQDNSAWVNILGLNNAGLVKADGNATGLQLQDTADLPVEIFIHAASGEIQELKIYGYRVGDSLRSLQIGVGVDAADTASFDGLSNYLFDGTIKNTGGRIISRTSVTSTPYTVLATDNHISVTTASTAITLNLPAIIDGTIYHIKDQDENASGKNITISPNGAETIENAASLTMNTNGASITIVGNSTTSNWEIQ